MLEASRSVWNESPCSLGFTSTQQTFQRAKRFRLFSIYARDDVNKQRKVFTDIEKPQLLLQHFRREIEEADSNRFKRSRLKSLAQRKKHNQTMDTKPSLASTITNRLYWPQPKASLEHDFFGNRSHFAETSLPSVELKESPQEATAKPKKKPSAVFTEAKRLDLSKPLNFYPGPGSYCFSDAYLPSDSSLKASRFRSKYSMRTTHRTVTDNNTHHE